MKWLVALVLVAALPAACGGHPPIPKRGVVESDLGDWKFRRFQPVLDVEVWVEGNRAEAFTASYVKDDAEKRGHIEDGDLVNVFVTRYAANKGILRETVKFARRLASEAGYTVDEARIGGVRAVTISGNGEAWVMWASKMYVVKVGGRNRDDVPESVVAKYGDRYPSLMPGGALEGPLPGDEPELERKTDDDNHPYDPNNPTPDWDKFDSKKTDQKIDESKHEDDDGAGDDDQGKDPGKDSGKDSGKGKSRGKGH